MKILIVLFSVWVLLVAAEPAFAEEPGTGELRVATPDGQELQIPLAHTSVTADIAGFVARVTVTQKFINPNKDPIEAVYVFPLPHQAAVDRMTMKIGDRVIKGIIKKREEAREIYEQAKKAGQTASLLEQERPNIFTQSVANIMPGDNIDIEISYVEVLKYEDGGYEFVFPMVVGPRYIPGERVVGQQGGGWSPDTERVPDASRITPPVLKPGQRSGHDIDVTVNLDAGVPIDDLRSPSHWIDTARDGRAKAKVTLDARDTIPNKDFILRYQVAGKAPAFGALAYRNGDEGYFLLVLAPKADYSAGEILPREVLFVIDSSGSQDGDPMAKSKDVVRRALKGLRPEDTFQVFNFNDIVTSMAPGPVPATAGNIRDARRFIDQIQTTGGTRMLPVIQTALNWPADPHRLRQVVMTTDGYIGNETEILEEIHKSLGDARLFMFGVGSSVNRYLIDRMAEEGRGAAYYVRQDEPAEEIVETFNRRLDAPVLRDLAIDWGGLAVADVFPARIPDLYAGQPLVAFGRFTEPGAATIRLTGKRAGETLTLKQSVDFAHARGNDQLATLWARANVERLMNQIEVGSGDAAALEKEVTDLGLRFNLTTKYTSFVAVEEQVRNVDGHQQTVQVPVEMPEGVSYEGVFGEAEAADAGAAMKSMRVGGPSGAAAQPMAPPPPPNVKPMPSPGLMHADEETDMVGAAPVQIDPVAFLGITNQQPYSDALYRDGTKALLEALKGVDLPKGKEMMVRLTLAKDGGVTKVEILKDAGSPTVEKIIRAALAKLRFPKGSGEAQLVFFLRF